MAVRWVCCLPLFQSLSKNDQLLLLEGSWTQLFLLHLAQWSISWNITGLLEDEQVRARLPDEATTNQQLITIQVIIQNYHLNETFVLSIVKNQFILYIYIYIIYLFLNLIILKIIWIIYLCFRIQYAVLGNFHQIEVNGDV